MQHGLNEQECVAEGLLALAAGSETTATVMRMTLLSLLASPPVYHALKAEVRATHVAEPVITMAQARELPYLRVSFFLFPLCNQFPARTC